MTSLERCSFATLPVCGRARSGENRPTWQEATDANTEEEGTGARAGKSDRLPSSDEERNKEEHARGGEKESVPACGALRE